MTAASRDSAARVRIWPPTRPPGPGEAVRTTCARCGLDWDVHEALAGFRLRCECDAWVPVPHPLGTATSVAPAPVLPAAAAIAASLEAEARRAPARPAAPAPRPAKPRKPGQPRARLLTRNLFGSLFLLAAVGLPTVAIQAEFGEHAWAVLWPTMGVLAATLLGLAALFGRARYLTTVRRARVSHVFEGLGVGLLGGAALSAALTEVPSGSQGMLWITGLIEELGTPFAAVALVLLPVLGHAFFFREVLARRLEAFAPVGWAATFAALFLTASHGFVPATPIVLALALHAAWLRRRSRSALPGLLEDLAVAGVVFGALTVA